MISSNCIYLLKWKKYMYIRWRKRIAPACWWKQNLRQLILHTIYIWKYLHWYLILNIHVYHLLNVLCNTALWGQTHFGVRPQSALNFAPHFGVKRTLGSKSRNWPQSALICYISTHFGSRDLKVSSEICLNTEYWLIFDLRHWNIWGGVQDGGQNIDDS
jgi:hypothetical protein